MRAKSFFVTVSVPLAFGAFALYSAACGGGNANGDGAQTPTSATAAASNATASTLPKPADHPESDKVTWTHGAKSCHLGTAASGDLAAAVSTTAAGCLDTGKMKMVGTPTKGQGAASGQNMVQQIPLAAKANHCYRVLGLADKGVADFDVAIMDSAGKEVAEDGTDTNDAVVLEDGNICFKVDDNVSVNAAVATGSGAWAVEIWSD